MKSSYLRPALALALALGLSACGGKATYTLGGPVDNLLYSGLVLTNSGAELAVAANATTFAFPEELEYGDSYDVTIKTQPQHQTCEVLRGNDTAGRMASITVYVRCMVNTFSVGGKVNGLTAKGLVLANGTTGGTVAIDPIVPAVVPPTAAPFIFPQPVAYGSSYGVTVLTNPAGQVCTVTNGVGEMQDAKVENIQVDCVPQSGG